MIGQGLVLSGWSGSDPHGPHVVRRDCLYPTHVTVLGRWSVHRGPGLPIPVLGEHTDMPGLSERPCVGWARGAHREQEVGVGAHVGAFDHGPVARAGGGAAAWLEPEARPTVLAISTGSSTFAASRVMRNPPDSNVEP